MNSITVPRAVADLIQKLIFNAYNDGVKKLECPSEQTLKGLDALVAALNKPEQQPTATGVLGAEADRVLIDEIGRQSHVIEHIHTCGPDCPRPACEIRRLKNRIARLEKRLAAVRQRRDSLRGFLRQTIQAFASNGAGAKVREASKNLTVKEILREKR